MKFKADIREDSVLMVELLMSFRTILSKIERKNFVLELDKEKIRMIIPKSSYSTEETIVCFTEFPTHAVFSQFRIENLSNHNKIPLLINVNNLLKCFKAAKEGDRITVKLAKRRRIAVLVFFVEVVQTGFEDKIIHIVQQCPVKMYKNVRNIDSPPRALELISIHLPILKKMKNALEKLSKFSNLVKVKISHNKLIFSSSSTSVKVQLEYTNLSHPPTSATQRAISDASQNAINLEEVAEVNVKDFLGCMSAGSINDIAGSSLSICENCVHFFFNSPVSGVNVLIFLPKRADEE